MAAASADIENKCNGTILRIKRQRDEDPLNTFIVHKALAKKSKVEENVEEKNNNCLFQLAGTIAENGIKTTNDLVKSFRDKCSPFHAANLKNKNYFRDNGISHSPNINTLKNKVKDEAKVKQKLMRYKIISNLRESNDESKDEDTFSIYDVEQLDDESVVPTADELLCNSVKMIREKLNLNDNNEVKITKDCDYVYDVYYAPNNVTVQNDEFMEIEEFYNELVDELDSEDVYVDTDDENDADNWRNDYPDEDYYDSSDGEKYGYVENSSEDDEDQGYNRYRTSEGRINFDPYGEYNVNDYFDTVADEDGESS